jgi:nucleoside-diphosphate-sugar epimerase
VLPRVGAVSDHLASRLEVERILLAGTPSSVALRSSIVIGARSRSFRFLVRLVERLPVLALPSWRDNLTRPIDERDIVEMLAACATTDAVSGVSLDVGGPDVVSYGGLVGRIRELMLVDRPTIGLGRLTVTPIASRVASVIAGEDHELIGPLMESLETDLLPRDDRAEDLLKVRLHSLNAAIERSLRVWEQTEPLAAR